MTVLIGRWSLNPTKVKVKVKICLSFGKSNFHRAPGALSHLTLTTWHGWVSLWSTHRKFKWIQRKVFDLRALGKDCNFSGSMLWHVQEVPGQIHMEMIELQSDSVLKTKLSNVNVDTLYQYVGPDYPRLKYLLQKCCPCWGQHNTREQLLCNELEQVKTSFLT